MLAQPLELPHRSAPVSRIDGAPHERLVRILIGGVHVEDPLPQPHGLQQPQIQRAQPFSRLLCPRGITILGEQVSPVGIQRSGLASAGGRFEGERIYCDRLTGAEFEHRAVAADGARCAKGSPGKVHGFAQVARGRTGRQIGP